MKNKIENVKKNMTALKDRGAFHIFIGNFIIKFVGLFGSIFIVRLLSKEEYGVLGYVENLCGYPLIIVGLGLANAMQRYGIIFEGETGKHSVYRFITKTQTLFNIVLIAVVGIISIFYPHPSEYIGVESLIIIYILSIPFTDITHTNLNVERTRLANKRYIRLSIFVGVFVIASRILGSLVGGVYGTVSFKVAADIIAAIVVMICVYKKYYKNIEHNSLSKNEKKEIVWYSIHNMLGNGIWVIFMLVDVLFIGQVLNNPDVLADYKVASVLPVNLAIITTSICVFATPYFIKNTNNENWIRKNYFRTIGVNAILVGGLSLIMFIFAEFFIVILYGSDYTNIVSLMRILIVANFINAAGKTINGGLLAAMGYAKTNMILSAIGLVVKSFLSLYAIYEFGVVGLAYSNIAIYSIISIVLFVIFVKKFNLVKIKKKEKKW